MFRLRGIGRNAKGWLLSGIGLAVLLSALGVGLFIATDGGLSRTAVGDTTRSPVAQDAENSGLTIDGRLVFPREAELTFGVGGTVGQVLVTDGQDVKAGQVLAKLEDLRLKDLEQKASLASLDLRRAQQALTRRLFRDRCHWQKPMRVLPKPPWLQTKLKKTCKISFNRRQTW